MNKKKWSRLTKISLVIVSIPILIYFWPMALGGDSEVLIVQGPSMLPTILPGSLILTKAVPEYQVDDIVSFNLIEKTSAFGDGGTHFMGIIGPGSVEVLAVEWVELTGGAGTDQTNLAGLYIFANCATLLTGSAPDSTQTSFFVQVPVGGEILPINTSALLLAGLTTNALWILPSLAVIAGAGIVILKFQLNRKTI